MKIRKKECIKKEKKILKVLSARDIDSLCQEMQAFRCQEEHTCSYEDISVIIYDNGDVELEAEFKTTVNQKVNI